MVDSENSTDTTFTQKVLPHNFILAKKKKKKKKGKERKGKERKGKEKKRKKREKMARDSELKFSLH
jgi:hypothetical protein